MQDAKPADRQHPKPDGYSDAYISAGYWRLRIKGKAVSLSRYIYQLEHGNIPKGWLISYRDGDSLNVSPLNLVAKPRGSVASSAHDALNDAGTRARDLPIGVYRRIKKDGSTVYTGRIKTAGRDVRHPVTTDLSKITRWAESVRAALQIEIVEASKRKGVG